MVETAEVDMVSWPFPQQAESNSPSLVAVVGVDFPLMAQLLGPIDYHHLVEEQVADWPMDPGDFRAPPVLSREE